MVRFPRRVLGERLLLAQCKLCGYIVWWFSISGKPIEEFERMCKAHLERHAKKGTIPWSAVENWREYFWIRPYVVVRSEDLPSVQRIHEEIAELEGMIPPMLKTLEEAKREGDTVLVRQIEEEIRSIADRIKELEVKIGELASRYARTYGEAITLLTPEEYLAWYEASLHNKPVWIFIVRSEMAKFKAQKGLSKRSISRAGYWLSKVEEIIGGGL